MATLTALKFEPPEPDSESVLWASVNPAHTHTVFQSLCKHFQQKLTKFTASSDTQGARKRKLFIHASNNRLDCFDACFVVLLCTGSTIVRN